MKHDHKHCIETALEAAEKICTAKKERLTPLRKQVLELLWQSHKARGAYDVLAALNKKAKKKIAPLSVYRALDFLVSAGLAHRLESLNAFIGCPHPSQSHAMQFLVCEKCRHVEELAADTAPLEKAAKAHAFTPRRTVIEVMGLCADCR